MQSFLIILFGVIIVPASLASLAWLSAHLSVAKEDARREAAFLAMFETEPLPELENDVNLLLEDEGHRREIKAFYRDGLGWIDADMGSAVAETVIGWRPPPFKGGWADRQTPEDLAAFEKLVLGAPSSGSPS